MNPNWIKSFVKSAGAILLAAALSRFLVAIGSAQFLPLPDPALGLPLRYTVLIVGGIELLVALICLFGSQIHFQAAWLVWLATNYIVFQIGLFWMHCHPQATCIGSLTDPLHLSRGFYGWITALLPVYLVLGSYTSLIYLWATGRAAVPVSQSEFIKISCPACGGHIKFAAENAGQRTFCPHCQTAVALQVQGTLKMSCVLCDGHIEFPTHAIGQKISCPHCAKPITLLGHQQNSPAIG
jgi:endogenous inhibitor of DNA gyrase (YacG/DUF329 family)